MRVVEIKVEQSSTRKPIHVKQITQRQAKKYNVDFKTLSQELIEEGYDWPRNWNDCNFYLVKYNGDTGVGMGPYDGEYCASEIREIGGFYLSDSNVTFKPL